MSDASLGSADTPALGAFLVSQVETEPLADRLDRTDARLVSGDLANTELRREPGRGRRHRTGTSDRQESSWWSLRAVIGSTRHHQPVEVRPASLSPRRETRTPDGGRSVTKGWYRLRIAQSTSINLDARFADFLTREVASGRYRSASEIVRPGLRLLEDRATGLAALRVALVAGEESGSPESFDFEEFLAEKSR